MTLEPWTKPKPLRHPADGDNPKRRRGEGRYWSASKIWKTKERPKGPVFILRKSLSQRCELEMNKIKAAWYEYKVEN
jgi:hypothetical protein